MPRENGDNETIEIDLPGGRRQSPERRGRSRLRVPLLTVLFHPDVSRVGDRLWLSRLTSGGVVEVSRLAPSFTAPEGSARRALEDLHLSRRPLRFVSGDSPGEIVLEPGGSGTLVEIDGGAVEGEGRFSEVDLERGVVLELARRVVLLLQSVPPRRAAGPVPRFDMVGESEAIVGLREGIRRVADLEVPVLLRGETGTGKELAARAIHRASRRRQGPWVSVNMSAIPASLAASELFGAVRGAFTGSDRDRPGYFRQADGGTLFLDEIGEAPPEVQVMLLRVLETGEIQSVGAARNHTVDVRVVAATDARLEDAIDSGRFKAPLFHRLSGYTLQVPRLAERREDVGRLLVHFLTEELAAVGELDRLDVCSPGSPPWLPTSIVARLTRYDWPGNVRELRNVVRQMVIESRGARQVRVGSQLEEVLQAAAGRRAPSEPSPPTPSPQPAYRPPAEVSEEELEEALRRNRWAVKPTAADLGVSRASLYNLMERSSAVRKASDLDRAEIEEVRERCGGKLEAMVEELEVSRSGLVKRMKELGLA
jgi:two-component system nitrogen regulation response regulator GlnG